MTFPSLPLGTHALSSRDGKLLVSVWKQGLLSRFGHDLILACDDLALTVTVAAEGGPWKIQGKVAKASFRVLEPETLSGKEKAEIRDKIQAHLPTDILLDVTALPAESSLRGSLSLGSKTASIFLPLVWEGRTCKGQTKLFHKDLGIAPYRAPLGLIQLKEEIGISFSFQIPNL